MKKIFIILLLAAAVLAGALYLGGIGKDEPAPAGGSISDAASGTAAEAENEAESENEARPESGSDAVVCSFETVDIDGNAVDSGIFADYKLTMINFWEPWCGPCVAEMPDLQKLYEDYSDKGFMLLGVFSTEDGVREILSDTGVKYPILYYTEGFDYFQTGYVPTTVFVNSQGEMLELQIGARSYEDWAAIIEGLL